jgi:predicted GNAT superfamily acetyltransferase
MTPSRKKKSSSRLPKPSTRDGILVRPLHDLDDFHAAVNIERAVWKADDIDLVPIPLFVVAAETGGQVFGAFDGSKMVGFTLAIAGWRDDEAFLHSHMTAVLESHRDHGIGRRLKLFQRDDALARDIKRVEWTFDPLMTKNAYFNLMRLGAIARRYLPNAYGDSSSALHRGLPTDRLIAEWHLDSLRVQRILSGKRATPTFSKKAVRITVPADIEALKRNSPREATRAQASIREQFQRQFEKNFAATAIAPGPSGMDYILEPWKKS